MSKFVEKAEKTKTKQGESEKSEKNEQEVARDPHARWRVRRVTHTRTEREARGPPVEARGLTPGAETDTDLDENTIPVDLGGW